MTTHTDQNIPEGWREETLGKYIDVKHGYAFSGEFITDIENKNILLTPGNFLVGGGWKDGKKFYSGNSIPTDYILRSGDIVVTMTDLSKDGDTLGYPAIIPNRKDLNYLHNQRVGLVQFTGEEISKGFLYWKFRTKDYQKTIVNSATGSTVRHTSPGRIKEYTFFLPPITEQRAIADILSSFDNKIELLREQNEILESTARTIFQEWFGKYSVENLEDLPEEWRVGRLGEVTDVKGGKRLSQGDNLVSYKTDHPYIRITDLTGNGIKKENLQYIEDNIYQKISRYTVNSGDIILSIVGSIGFVAKIDEDLNNANLTENCAKFINLKFIGSNYLFYFLISEFGQGEIVRNTVGAVQKKLPIYGIQNMEILIPTKDVIQRFEEIVGEFSIKIFSNNSQIQSLSKTRDELLPRLMSGEVRVR